VTTSATELDAQRDLLAWLDERDARYEVLDGVVLVSPPDRLAHSEAGLRVAAALVAAAPEGVKVLGPSYAVRYAPGSFVLPDVVVAPAEDCGQDGIRTAPLLVVAVLSPSTRRRDLGEKREIYAALGVPHYWLVDPEQHTATALRLQGGTYVEAATATAELVVQEPFAVRLPL
jgi:Uma2 family endonuclease